MLEHHADAHRNGVSGRPEMLLHPVDFDGALVGTMGTVERLHQCRFARPVLAHNGVDGGRTHREVHTVVGHHSGEALHDVPKFNGGGRRGHG